MRGARGLLRAGACALVAAAAAGGALGCGQGRGPAPLGLPDAYLLYAPALDDAGKPRRSEAGLPLLDELPLDDARAVPFHKLFTVGFAGEMLRTDYLLKQFVREASWRDRRFSAEARAAASEPTVFIVQRDGALAGRGVALKGFFGRASDRADVGWLSLTDEPERDLALPQTLAGHLGRRIAATLAAGGAPAEATSLTAAASGAGAADPLVAGYASAMEVIAREWRVGEGPRGTLAPDAGTEAQRDLFASVRQNRFVTADGDPSRARPAAELLHSPGVAATVLYRMAQSKAIGHRVAPEDLYAPFIAQRVPSGVSPAAVLGPFRNFQAKLIAAWGRAVLRGAAPRDIADLVDVYAAELPAERAEVIRLFVVTTLGATVKPGGVVVKNGDAGAALPELTALAAEVTAGRRSLHAALQ
jgi:hypothetical protein